MGKASRAPPKTNKNLCLAGDPPCIARRPQVCFFSGGRSPMRKPKKISFKQSTMAGKKDGMYRMYPQQRKQNDPNHVSNCASSATIHLPPSEAKPRTLAPPPLLLPLLPSPPGSLALPRQAPSLKTAPWRRATLWRQARPRPGEILVACCCSGGAGRLENNISHRRHNHCSTNKDKLRR